MPVGRLSHKVLQDRQRSLMFDKSNPRHPMVFYTSTNYGCIFTIDEDQQELYYAPIYDDSTVNLSEFAPVDMDEMDMDDMEMYDIRNLLIEMCQV